MKYLIYSDESGHDKYITKNKRQILNIDIEHQFREYIRVYCMVKEEYLEEFEKAYQKCEDTVLEDDFKKNFKYKFKKNFKDMIKEEDLEEFEIVCQKCGDITLKEEDKKKFIKNFKDTFKDMIKEECLDEFKIAYQKYENMVLEEDLKKFKEKKEVKGKMFTIKEDIKGISELEESHVDFIKNVITILKKCDIKSLVFIQNKIEYVMDKVIIINKKFPMLSIDEVKYSYAKYISNHYNDKLLKSLMSKSSRKVNKFIQKFFEDKNEELSDSYLKENEYMVGRGLLFLLKNGVVKFNTSPTYKWDYERETDIILNYLDKENGYQFCFDKGTKVTSVFKNKTKSYKHILKVEEEESHKKEMLRMADIIATFFGKLLRSVSDSFKMKDLEKVNHLHDNWFDLIENHFHLIKLINDLIESKYIQVETSRNADNTLILLNYFNYVGSYETYNEFKQYQIYNHHQLFEKKLITFWNNHYNDKNKMFFDSRNLTAGKSIYN